MNLATRRWLACAAASAALFGASTVPAAAHSPQSTSHHHLRQCPAPLQLTVMQTALEYAQQLRKLRGAELETTFLASMIGHHQMAIDMAQMEIESGQRPAAKALARRIITEQREEITMMRGWLQDWYGMTPAEALSQSPAADIIATMSEQMESEMMRPMMQAAPGTQTDLAFLQLMTRHHQMAVIEAAAAIPGTEHHRLTRLEAQIIDSQLREIRLMRTWVCAWFGNRHAAA